MSVLSVEHTTAISHAQFMMTAYQSHEQSGHTKREIEKDLSMLEDIKLSILRSIYTPNLPFGEGVKKNGD